VIMRVAIPPVRHRTGVDHSCHDAIID